MATLALGYQGGTKALVNMGALRMGIPEKDLPDIKNKWRKANPHIVQFWDYCQKAAISAIETGRSFRIRQLLTFSMVETEHLRLLAVKLPSGRQIFYPKPGIGVNRFGEKSITYWGTSTGSGDKQSSKKWRQLETYGGKLTENVVQAIARDCLAVNLDRLEKAGYDVRFHIHDEVVCSQDTNCLDEIVEIMSQPIDWAPGLPLNADGWCGNYFTKD